MGRHIGLYDAIDRLVLAHDLKVEAMDVARRYLIDDEYVERRIELVRVRAVAAQKDDVLRACRDGSGSAGGQSGVEAGTGAKPRRIDFNEGLRAFKDDTLE